LRHLWLGKSKRLTNVDALKDFKALQTLGLSCEHLANVDWLKGLSALKTLTLSYGFRRADITALMISKRCRRSI